MRALLPAALCLALAACGDDDPAPRPVEPGPRPPAQAETGRAAVKVVRTWVDRLRRGDVDGAARTFALPAIVQNGGETLRLARRRDVREWLALLPCGARFVRSEVVGEYVVATFRLTHRRGSRCDAPGGLAATAFLVRGGHIAEWRRVPVPSRRQRVLPPDDLEAT